MSKKSKSNRKPSFEVLPAPLWRRCAAMLYDSLLLIACYMLTGGLYVSFMAGALDLDMDTISPMVRQLTLFPLLLLITALFFSYFWIRHGRTLGMQTWKLQVISTRYDAIPPDRRLSVSQSLLRIASALLSILSCGIGFLWALLSPSRLTWHDILSRSQVVYLPPKK